MLNFFFQVCRLDFFFLPRCLLSVESSAIIQFMDSFSHGNYGLIMFEILQSRVKMIISIAGNHSSKVHFE